MQKWVHPTTKTTKSSTLYGLMGQNIQTIEKGQTFPAIPVRLNPHKL